MDWIHTAVTNFCEGRPPSGYWKEFADSINVKNPTSAFGVINEYLETKTFLLGHSVSPEDFYLASILMKCPSWNKILTSKTRPFHICRWFMQVFSIHPDNSFDFYRRRNEKIDGRLVKALKENNLNLFYRLLELVDLNAKSPSDKGERPIHTASLMGNVEALKKLLELGVSIETEDEDGLTPIFYAVQSKSMEVFDYLRRQGANIFHVEKQGRSLFYWAASLGKIEMLGILLAEGLDPNQPTILGRTALSKSAWNGNAEVLRYLLSIPTINIEIPDRRGRTALHNAVWGCAGGREGRKMGQNAKDSPECALLLLEKGANIEAQDGGGNTPLCIACSTYAPKSERLLLKYHANTHHSGIGGYTPYHQALSRGNVKCANILIQHGYDINTIGRGYTPLQISLKYSQINSLHWLVQQGIAVSIDDVKFAAKFSEPVMIEALLKYLNIENPADIIMDQGSLENIMWAVENLPQTQKSVTLAVKKDKKIGEAVLHKWQGEITPEMLEAMIEAKIDPSPYLERTFPTGYILRLAIKKSNLSLSKSILTKNPSLHNEVDSYSGNTALHIACISGLSDLIPVLIGLNPNPIEYITRPNNKGLTPIILAQLHKRLYIAEMLKDMSRQCSNSAVLSSVKVLDFEDTTEELTPHPYALEMPLGYWPSKFPLLEISASPFVWIDTVQGLHDMVAEIKPYNVIGIDLEYHLFQQKKGCLCLVQVSTGAKDFIIDALTNRNELAKIMQEIMQDKNVQKVFHGADSDLLWLQNDFDAHPVRVFDTARAFKIANNDNQLPSLAGLLLNFFGMKIDKSFQIAEWRIRPLPIAMLDYARNDAHHLPALCNKLLEKLSEEQVNNLNSQCNAMCLKSPKGKLDRIKLLINE